MTIDDHRCPFISHYSLLFIKLSIDDMMKLGPPFSWPPLQLSQEFLLGLCFILWYCLKSEAWKGNQQRHCLIFFRAEKILWFLVFLSQQIGDKTGQILRLIWFLKVVDSPRVWWSANDFQSGAKWCRVALDMGQLAQTLMDRELCTGKSVPNGKYTEMSINKTAMDKDHIDVGHFGYWSIWIIHCWIPNFDEIHCDIGIANPKQLGLWVNFIATSPFSRSLEWWLWSVNKANHPQSYPDVLYFN